MRGEMGTQGGGERGEHDCAPDSTVFPKIGQFCQLYKHV